MRSFNGFVSDFIATGVRTPEERMSNFRSNVVETLRWYCSERRPHEITSALEELFAAAPSCSLLRCETIVHRDDAALDRTTPGDPGSDGSSATELPFYSEPSGNPSSLVQLCIDGGSLDGQDWQVRIELAVKADSESVWQTVFGDISTNQDSFPNGAGEFCEKRFDVIPEVALQFQNELVLGYEEMTAELVHELRSPLSAIMTSAELVMSREGENLNSEDRELLAIIGYQAERVNSRFGDLVKSLEPVVPNRSKAGMIDLLRDAAKKSPFVSDATVQSWLSSEASWTVEIDRALFSRAILFMLEDLPRSVAGCEAVHVRCRPVGDSIAVQFEYSGEGIRPDVLRKVVLPFDSTRDGGSGLDGPPVHRIVSAHGGTTSISSSESVTIITITIPLCTTWDYE